MNIQFGDLTLDVINANDPYYLTVEKKSLIDLDRIIKSIKIDAITTITIDDSQYLKANYYIKPQSLYISWVDESYYRLTIISNQVDKVEVMNTEFNKKWNDVSYVYNIGLRSISDADALKLKKYLSNWDWNKKQYVKNDLVIYNNKVYRATQNHESNPNNPPATDTKNWYLCEVKKESVYEEWMKPLGTPKSGYPKSYKVSWKDTSWISLADDNQEEPGTGKLWQTSK